MENLHLSMIASQRVMDFGLSQAFILSELTLIHSINLQGAGLTSQSTTGLGKELNLACSR